MHKNKHKSHKDKHHSRNDHRGGSDRRGRGHGHNDRPGRRDRREQSPENENERAKAQYAELDAEEVEHLRLLDEKYRDRARERREGLIDEDDLDEKGADYAQVTDPNDEEVKVKKGGLDFELFRKAVAEEEKKIDESSSSDYSSSDESETPVVVQKPKPKIVEEVKPQEFRTKLGQSIYKSLFKPIVAQETKRNIFKGNCCYEFDTDFDFGSNLPKLIIRNKEEDPYAEPIVIPKVNENIFKKLDVAMVYIKTGKRIEKEPVKVVHPRAPSTNTFSGDDDDDDDDCIFPEAKKKVKTEIEPSKSLFADLEEKKIETIAKPKGVFEKSSLFNDTKIKDEEEEYNAREITKKNKEMMEKIAAQKGEERLNKLFNRGDSYMEAFPEMTPELEDLKQQQAYVLRRNEGRRERQKSTKVGNDEVDKVNKMMKEKSSKKGSG